MHLPGTGAPQSQKYDEYLSLGIAAAAARYADVYVARARGLETDSSAYESFVRSAANQASDANPNVEILSGLSTGRTGCTACLGNARRRCGER